jgi:hypothetical protein
VEQVIWKNRVAKVESARGKTLPRVACNVLAAEQTYYGRRHVVYLSKEGHPTVRHDMATVSRLSL